MNLNDLRKTAALVLEGKNEANIPAHRDADMGGSGDEHEINWGDVTDVVKDDVEKAVEECVRQSMVKSRLEATEGEGGELRDMPEYQRCMKLAEELGVTMGEMLKRAHKEGRVSIAAMDGR